MDLVELSRGDCFTICALADSGAEESLVEQFLASLPKPARRKLFGLIERVAAYGLPFNPEKSRALKGSGGIFEFKSKPYRIFYFFSGERRLVLTHGFTKYTDRTPPEEIERALRLRERFLAER